MQRSQTHFPDRADSITPSDADNFPPKTLLVIDGGDVVVQPKDNADGNTVTLTAVPAYFVIPFRVVKVLATGTTAANIVGIG